MAVHSSIYTHQVRYDYGIEREGAEAMAALAGQTICERSIVDDRYVDPIAPMDAKAQDAADQAVYAYQTWYNANSWLWET